LDHITHTMAVAAVAVAVAAAALLGAAARSPVPASSFEPPTVQQLTESTYTAAVCSFEPETLLITEINPHLLLPGAATDAPEVGVIVAREDDDEADLLRVGDAGPEDDLGAGVVDSEYEPEGHVVEEVRTVQQNITALEGTLTKAKKACELAKAVVRHSGGGGGGSGSGGSADQEAVVVDPAASTLQKMDAPLPMPKVQEERAHGNVHARKPQDAFVPVPQDVHG
jgi:hypothetical protein